MPAQGQKYGDKYGQYQNRGKLVEERGQTGIPPEMPCETNMAPLAPLATFGSLMVTLVTNLSKPVPATQSGARGRRGWIPSLGPTALFVSMKIGRTGG